MSTNPSSNQQLKRLRVLAGSSIVGADLKWLLGEYDLLREKADKRGDKLHELRTTLAGMIEAVRALNVDRKDWYTYVAMPLQNAYEALGIQGVKLSQEEITALANSPVETTGNRSVTLNGYQLKAALEFVAPDNDPEQLESEVSIQWGDAGHSGSGYYCCMAEYSEEGSILLDDAMPDGAAMVGPPADPQEILDALSAVEPSPRMAVEGDLVPEQWWRVHRELANGHTSAALAIVAAVLEGKPLPECAACNVAKLTINAEKASEKCPQCQQTGGFHLAICDRFELNSSEEESLRERFDLSQKPAEY